jgi:hypothetical protein
LEDYEQDDHNGELHHITFITNTGQILGVSQGMHDVFGLDPKFLSDLQEKNRPTIEQIFPDLKINEAKSNFIEADIDTTLLSDLHMMIRSKGEVYS